jgi:hypothetical protein
LIALLIALKNNSLGATASHRQTILVAQRLMRFELIIGDDALQQLRQRRLAWPFLRRSEDTNLPAFSLRSPRETLSGVVILG